MSNTFQQDLESLINRHAIESGSDTPDFILAEYLLGCLAAWNTATTAREKWYGRAVDDTASVAGQGGNGNDER